MWSAWVATKAGIRVLPSLTPTTDISSGKCRVTGYLLSPLECRVSEAGRER